VLNCGVKPSLPRFLAISVGILIVSSGLAVASPVPAGFLEGRLKIVLSRGVNLADDNSPTPEPPPYAEYPLVVLGKDGSKEVAQVIADKDGHYRVSLPPGDYVLKVKGAGRRQHHAAPHPFKIVAGQTVQVDMDVKPDVHVM
jgi:hypothetical protein